MRHLAQTTESRTATDTRPSSGARRLTFDHLWIIALLALIWFLISLLPLPPNDLWWHMAAGRTMLAEGSLLRENRWAFTLAAHAPYVYQSWLSEIMLYGLWRLADVPALTLARTVAIVGGYGLLAWHAQRRSGSGRAAALALLLAVLIGWNNWTLRPQTLALLPGAAFAVILGEYLGGRLRARWLALLPLLMFLWVNMHGSFVLGIVLLGMAWLGASIDRYRRRIIQPDAHAQYSIRALGIALAATLLAALLNPLGLGIIGYLGMMLGNESLRTYFVEWQPPTLDGNPLNTGVWFFAMLLLLAALMATGRRRPTTTELLWYLALSWLAIGGVRYAMWYGLLLMPLLANQIAGWMPTRASTPVARGFTRIFGVLLAGMILATLPWLTPGRYLGAGADALFAPTGEHHLLLSNTTPLAATAWLKQNPIQGNFWADMSYTSYTIWELPGKQVFADLRVELFPEPIWQDYFTIARGDQRSLAMLDHWQITHLMTNVNWQRSLNELLGRTPGWCQRYADTTTLIWARCQE